MNGHVNVRPCGKQRIYERNSPRKNALNRVNIQRKNALNRVIMQSRIIMMEALPKSLTKLCMTYGPKSPPSILTAKRYSANMPAPKAYPILNSKFCGESILYIDIHHNSIFSFF